MIESWANSATRQFAMTGKCKFSGLDESRALELLTTLNAAPSLKAPAEERQSSRFERQSKGSVGGQCQGTMANLFSISGWKCLRCRNYRLPLMGLCHADDPCSSRPYPSS